MLMAEICEIDNLLLAYHKAIKGKRQLRYAIDYSGNLFSNIVRLQEQLLSGTYEFGNYHYFHIYDPKYRKICAAAFEERIIHHAIINICHIYFEKHLIYDTYATRLGKGIYSAIKRARIAMRSYRYVAKLDVKSYFDSISHVTLKKKLRRLFKDGELLSLLDKIIDSHENTPGYGIPIGNLTSQYFANFYLSFLDHYAKEILKIPVYVRYMDDILIFGESLSQIKKYVNCVCVFVGSELSLNMKQPVYAHVESGVSFLGYSLFPNKILLNRRSKIRFKRKMYQYSVRHKTGVWNDVEYKDHLIPLLAFVNKAYTKGLRKQTCLRLYS